MTDQDLIRRAADGDPDAFRILAAEHRPQAVRIARALLNEEADAEDVAQEMLVRLAASLPGFRMEAELSTWVYRVTLNLCRDHIRRTRRRSAHVSVDDAPPSPALVTMPTPDRSVDAERAGAAVRAAVDALPQELKEALMLRYAADLSYKEISGMTQTPQGTVASRIFRALQRIGESLDPRHMEALP